MIPRSLAALALIGALNVQAGENTASAASTIAALDTEYQAAVERNDWRVMDRILHPDFVLVLGDGATYSRAQLIDSARNRNFIYDEQVEVPGTQIVRVFGENTATVTALLIVKARRARDSSELDYKLWFTDTYVRTREGWRYAFGQASTPMPAAK